MSEIDIALGVLDHQLMDSEGIRCGKVDNIELEGLAEGRPAVAAILTGPAAWRTRGRLARRFARGRVVRIPWSEVDHVEAYVVLRRPAHELGLARSEERARRVVERFPGSSL